MMLLVQGAVALIWLRAGIGKLTDVHFAASMKGTLGAFASHNPQGWFREFLTSSAIPHATFFGRLIEFSETAVGVALVATALLGMRSVSQRTSAAAGVITVGALAGGILMNVNYWLATSWMGPADDTVNTLMVAIQLVLAVPLAVALAHTVRVRGADAVRHGAEQSVRAAA